jgi:hypothetical protein
LPAVNAPIPQPCRELSLAGGERYVRDPRAPIFLSEQSASHGKRHKPRQPSKTQTAEHGSGAEIFNSPDLVVLLGCHVIGEFFDPSVEEFYREHDEQ